MKISNKKWLFKGALLAGLTTLGGMNIASADKSATFDAFFLVSDAKKLKSGALELEGAWVYPGQNITASPATPPKPPKFKRPPEHVGYILPVCATELQKAFEMFEYGDSDESSETESDESSGGQSGSEASTDWCDRLKESLEASGLTVLEHENHN